MTDERRAATDTGQDRPLDRALLLAMVVAPFALALTHGAYRGLALAPLAAVLVYFWRRRPALFARALFWPLFFVGLLALPWPLSFIVPLGLYLAIYAAAPRLRAATGWLAAGRFTAATLAWMLPTILVTSGSLLAWVFLFRPDLTDLARMVPASGPVALVVVGVLFSLGNAVWEELILKGIAWNSLAAVFRSDWAINVGQAALFGIIHVGGFPRGWIGVLMATLYGLVLGVIRRQSRGLAAPIVTHVFADATIFVILYLLSAGVLPRR